MSQANILDRLSALRRRHLRLALWAGMAIGLIALICGTALCMWVDVVMELAPALRIAAAAFVLVGCAIVLVRPVALARARITRQQLAREFDRAGGHAGQILTGSDLAQANGNDQTAANLTQALAVMSIERASGLADGVPLENAAPSAALRRWQTAATCVVALAAMVTLLAPRLVRMQWARLVDPFGDHPPYSRVELTVAPGNTSALFGQGVDVSVTATQELESAEMVWQALGSAPQVLPMFRETTGRWRGTIAEARESGDYFIRTPSARSYKYKVDVIMVPQISAVRFRITPPAYTRKPVYEGPVPQDGISGLSGTKVEVMATSNRPLAEGMLQVPAAISRATTQPVAKLALAPSAPKATEVRGEFTISESGKLSIQVKDTEGHWSTDPFTAQVKLLKDQRPIVRLVQPEPLSLATPSAMLAIQVNAEDDYGITHMQVFRSLDGSRPRGSDLSVPVPTVARADGTEMLNLAAFRLHPGETLEFFARAEDNDPAGAKGSETPVTVVKIISEEQMRELELASAGLETLQNKYQQAERLMESLQEQLAAADKQIKQNGEMSPETRKQLEKTIAAFEKAQGQLDQLLEDKLPLALDEQLRKEIADLNDQVGQASDALKQADAKTPGSVASAVSRATDTLNRAKQQYEKNAIEPLDQFAKVYAIKEDEARFVELYNRQKDLAERLSSLKNQSVVDDPAAQARLRDLEDQQREIREDLSALLDQIEAHAAQLADDPAFARLRKSAIAFVEKARASGADRAMVNAEVAMPGFNGKDSWTNADEAARILFSLLSQCNNTGDEAGNSLTFAPGLSGAMGQTIEELLASQGMRSGRNGIGQGGYSAHRNTLQNVGLYGMRPKTSRPQSGRDASGGGMMLKTQSSPTDANALGPKTASAGRANSAPQVPVPAEYRRRVNDYYQRVADELGTTKSGNTQTEK